MEALLWEDGTVTYKDSKGKVITRKVEKIIVNKNE